MVTLEIMGSTTPWERVERCLVWSATALGGEHGVVDLKNALFGAVAAMGLFVFLPDNRELVEDIGHGITWLREVVLERGQLLWCLTLYSAPAAIVTRMADRSGRRRCLTRSGSRSAVPRSRKTVNHHNPNRASRPQGHERYR